jgi:hypothetical protein
MKELLNKEDQDLDEKRKNQITRSEVTVHRADKEEPETIENVQLIHEVDGWTLFETVDGENKWRNDDFLAGYDDPEGGA